MQIGNKFYNFFLSEQIIINTNSRSLKYRDIGNWVHPPYNTNSRSALNFISLKHMTMKSYDNRQYGCKQSHARAQAQHTAGCHDTGGMNNS